VIESGRPGVSNLFRGLVTGREVVAIDVPVKGPEGAVVAILSLSPRREVFADALRHQGLPSSWLVGIFDRKGVLIARSRDEDQFVGQQASSTILSALVNEKEGIRESISREGIALLTAFSHGEEFGWGVAIGVPRTELTAPAVDTAWRTLAISAILLALAIGVASLLARQILGPIAVLRQFATEGAPIPETPRTGLRETDAFAEALRAAGEQRRRSEQSFRYLFESSPLPKWVYDPVTLGFLAVNDAAIETYGYSREEFLAMRVSDLGPPEDVERVKAAVKSAGARQHVVDLRHRYKDGRLVDIESYSHPLTFEGRSARVVVILDVTARKAAEEQLRQSQKMEAVGQLTGGMAHDFNNLLGVIIGNLGLLADGGPEDPDFMMFVNEALAAAQRGAALNQSLLAFARRQPLRPVSVKLDKLVTGIVALLRRTLGERVEVVLDLKADVWPVVVDPSRLEAALINLATNARDAMPKGGRLEIAVMSQRLDEDYAAEHAEVTAGDYALLQVSDSGTGIPPDMLTRIFEPFFTTKGRGEGTGLGLSMVFGFMKQSGGHINVYSEPGVGTTFRLYLPRDRAPEESRETAGDESLPRGRGETVLVVEDDPALRRVVVRQIGQLGYRVEEAENAVEALKLLERGRAVDILFTDVVMAGRVDGFDLSRIVAQRWPATKIILTSGFPAPRASGEIVITPDTPLLSKPYQRRDLARILVATLRRDADATA
jgi:PAS domain S-box-containing protein